MKTRIGFVSNSSSTSFCIYGWNTEYDKELVSRLREIMESETILSRRRAEHEIWIGVGANNDPITNDGGDIIDANIPELTESKLEAIDEIAKKYNLPPPEMVCGTWYNG